MKMILSIIVLVSLNVQAGLTHPSAYTSKLNLFVNKVHQAYANGLYVLQNGSDFEKYDYKVLNEALEKAKLGIQKYERVAKRRRASTSQLMSALSPALIATAMIEEELPKSLDNSQLLVQCERKRSAVCGIQYMPKRSRYCGVISTFPSYEYRRCLHQKHGFKYLTCEVATISGEEVKCPKIKGVSNE